MTNSEAVNWIINISSDIGKVEHRDLWHYEQALSEIREMLEGAQPQRKSGKTLAEEVERIKRELTDIFAEQMSAQPQRIKGRWIRRESDLSWWYECSECGESPLFDPYEHEVRSPFCPWCGAEMRGDGNE